MYLLQHGHWTSIGRSRCLAIFICSIAYQMHEDEEEQFKCKCHRIHLIFHFTFVNTNSKCCRMKKMPIDRLVTIHTARISSQKEFQIKFFFDHFFFLFFFCYSMKPCPVLVYRTQTVDTGRAQMSIQFIILLFTCIT